jgi:hypothetical protein
MPLVRIYRTCNYGVPITIQQHTEHSSSYVCLCSIQLLALANESQAHSTDSRFLLSFTNARIAQFFVNLLRLPAVNHPQAGNILSTYA